MTSATVRNYLEGTPSERIAILVFTAVALGIVALGVALAVNTVWRLATLPRNWRGSKARAAPFINAEAFSQFFGDIKLFEVAMGIVGFLICLSMIVVVLLFAEDLLTRKGHFGGGGAEMVWPVPPGR